jgi:signal transduction histidine kinase/CheY-like chemotaxis protein/HPt (histidine-containing phosphotransfer) domain-containing protein
MNWLGTMRKKVHIKKVLVVGFCLALLIATVSGIISYKSTNRLLETANGLSDSHFVYGSLKEIIAEVSFAENCEKSYVLTGKYQFLLQCYNAIKSVNKKIKDLKSKTSNNPNQLMRLEMLEPMIEKRFGLIDEIIKTRKNKGYEAAMEIIISHRSIILMNSIHNMIGLMENEESELLEQGMLKAKIFSSRIKTIIILGNLITILVLGSSLLVIFIDISHRNYFEQELIKAKEIAERSVQVKEHFLANISHEIRTPMNAISGLTKILLRKDPTIKQKEYLDAIKTSSDILLVIINDILDLSKVQSGKMIFEKTDFKIAPLVSSITDLLNSRAEEKGLKLFTQYDDNIPEILIGDPVRLNQIILNLVSNAIKFTEKGEIHLIVNCIERFDNSAKIEFIVKDTGIGIPQEIIPVIFESFTQASTEITRKYGGTGLGLNIVKELVERQGGTITVESNLNQGSVFIVTLNYGIASNISNKNSNITQKLIKKRLSDIKVLLVEDNVINQLVAKSVLKEFNFISDVADNGKQALEKIKSNNYDIILMDIQMPEMSGYDVTRYIRNKLPKPLCNLPIIAMTANAGKNDAEKCIRAGMDDYVSKPFDEHVLYDKICFLIEKNKNVTEKFQDNNPDRCTNLKYLQDISGGNKKFMSEIIELFMKQTPAAILNMKKHLQNNDYEKLATEAHKIKPSFNFLGICGLEELAGRIEKSVRSGNDTSHIPDSLKTMEEVCDSAFMELKEELKNLKYQKF